MAKELGAQFVAIITQRRNTLIKDFGPPERGGPKLNPKPP